MDSVEIYLKYITTNLSHKSLYTNLKPTKLIDSQITIKTDQHFDKKLLDPHDALNSITKPKYETTYKIDNEKQKKKMLFWMLLMNLLYADLCSKDFIFTCHE